jgi:translation initiation factor 5B
MKDYVNIVPTSAHTGEGIGDLLYVASGLPQNRMSSKLVFNTGLHASVLEVKVLPGLGTTVDVILINGVLKEVGLLVSIYFTANWIM